MSFLDRLGWKSGSRQIAIAISGIVILSVILVAIYLVALRTKYEILFTDLRQADAATIVAQLEKDKVPYQLRNRGETILVPKDRVDKTRLDLMGGDLPLKGTVGFELFNKSDMGITEFAQKINYQRALQGELARTIMAMDGVEEARVHLSMAEPTIFRDDRVPPKASVSVKMALTKPLTTKTIRGIQRLIAAAIPDLVVSNVVVLDGQGDVVSEAVSEGMASVWTEQKLAVEEHFASKIEAALHGLLPTERFDVAVHATILPGALIPNPEEVARDYPLRVSVLSNLPLAEAKETLLRSVILREIGSDPSILDAVSVSSVASAPSPETVAPAGALTAAGVVKPAIDIRTAIFAALFVMLIAAALLTRFRPKGLRRLSARERQDYADRLKFILDGTESHGLS